MRASMYLGGLVVAILSAGCQSPIAGTWKSAGCCEAGPIKSVSFCNDGTFSATADCGGQNHTMSGCYKLKNGWLKLRTGCDVRKYCAEVCGCHLLVTSGGKSQVFKKVKCGHSKCGQRRCGSCRDSCGEKSCGHGSCGHGSCGHASCGKKVCGKSCGHSSCGIKPCCSKPCCRGKHCKHSSGCMKDDARCCLHGNVCAHCCKHDSECCIHRMHSPPPEHHEKDGHHGGHDHHEMKQMGA